MAKTEEHDVINHPSHYAEGRMYEPIDVFIDWGLGPLEWQVCKYLSRLGRKGDALEDARKAQFYLNRLVEELEAERNEGSIIGNIDADRITADSLDGTSITINASDTVDPQAIADEILEGLRGLRHDSDEAKHVGYNFGQYL